MSDFGSHLSIDEVLEANLGMMKLAIGIQY
jgi:hypothetical protein